MPNCSLSIVQCLAQKDRLLWLQRQDFNLRPSRHERVELPGTPLLPEGRTKLTIRTGMPTRGRAPTLASLTGLDRLFALVELP